MTYANSTKFPLLHYSIILLCGAVFFCSNHLKFTHTCSLIKPICKDFFFIIFRNSVIDVKGRNLQAVSLSHTHIKAHFPFNAHCFCTPQIATQYVTSLQLFYHCTSGRPICGQPEHFDRSLETATSAVQRRLDKPPSYRRHCTRA